MIPDLKPELNKLITEIRKKNMYHGNRIPDSIMKLFEIEETDSNTGILVPYWLGVLQKGRGPRKSTKSSGLVHIIFAWMQKRNMFKSKTEKGKFNEAKGLTWYINKYGNQQFRNKVFVDIYESERKKTIAEINQKYSLVISKITMEVI